RKRSLRPAGGSHSVYVPLQGPWAVNLHQELRRGPRQRRGVDRRRDERSLGAIILRTDGQELNFGHLHAACVGQCGLNHRLWVMLIGSLIGKIKVAEEVTVRNRRDVVDVSDQRPGSVSEVRDGVVVGTLDGYVLRISLWRVICRFDPQANN